MNDFLLGDIEDNEMFLARIAMKYLENLRTLANIARAIRQTDGAPFYSVDASIFNTAQPVQAREGKGNKE